MKPAIPALVLGVVVLVGAVLAIRNTDPRPAAAEIRTSFRAVATGLGQVTVSADTDHSFGTLLAAYRSAAVAMAPLQLKFGTDPDVRAFAERIMATGAGVVPEPAAAEGSEDEGVAALVQAHGMTAAAIKAGAEHIGTPDEQFVQAMLPLYEGTVALAEVELALGRDAGMRAVAADVVLLEKSAVGSMKNWLGSNEHAH
jgi:uncharacterized protein (DUF305 family)